MSNKDFLIFKSKLVGIIADVVTDLELRSVGETIKVTSQNKEYTYNALDLFNKSKNDKNVLDQFRTDVENKFLNKSY